METSTPRPFRKLAVIGAGNMGSGIAQKMATEGFNVVLVDLDDEKVTRGMETIRTTLAQGVERKIFRPAQADEILGRVEGTSDWNRLGDVDLVVEAVFEDAGVKRQVFERLDGVCRKDAILATNTSSLAVTQLADATRHPERVIGLHYFYHPAKNRLVEVVPGQATDPDVTRDAWSLQEQLGKTPIASNDTFGFVVNRFFVPWLNEAVRLLEENVADIPTIEQACKKTFGVGMGPFELMNVTGVPIALHSATTLGQELGAFYAPTDRLRQQVESGENWNLEGTANEANFQAVSDHMLAVVFFVAAELVDGGVGTIEDTDIGARVGLRWPRGPFQMMNRLGIDKAAALIHTLDARWELGLPGVIKTQLEAGHPFEFKLINSEVHDGIATLTVNRPDAMNALNEQVVEQLHDALRAVAADPQVDGIVIAGAGKAFIAGADIRFFVKNIEAKNVNSIVDFTKEGHALLNDIASCPKPVVARLHGLALGGGLELALACRHIVASAKARVAFPETGIGIYPGLGGTQRAPRRVGTGLAKWMIYTGQMLSAKDARDIGLVDLVVPHSELDTAIRQVIRDGAPTGERTRSTALAQLANVFDSNNVETILSGQADAGGDEKLGKALKQVGYKAPVALRLTEKLVDLSVGSTLEEGLQAELDHLPEIFGTEDAYEGLSSLGRKRPEFKGR